MPRKDAIVRGYARALFAVAEAEGSLGVVEDELFAFAKAVEREGGLREALTDPALPAERKRALVDEIFAGKANPVTVNVLHFLVEQGRAREIASIIQGLAEVAAEQRQHQMAEVRTAVPLTQKQRASLADALSKATGRDVEVKAVVDPTVIGGALAKVGDEVFDGTVRARLEDARQILRSR